MNRIILILLFIFTVSGKVFSQKNFQGEVIYNVFIDTINRPTIIHAFFGEQVIKISITNSGNKLNGQDQDLIMDLKNGVIHFLIPTLKTYRTDSINTKTGGTMPVLIPSSIKNRTILDYHAVAFTTVDTAKSDFMGRMEINIWYADSLYFLFDKKFALTEMLPMFGNGTNIALGSEMTIGSKDHTSTFIATAIAVQQKVLPDSVLMIPMGYVEEKDDHLFIDSTVTADSLVMAAQSAADSMIGEAIKKNNKKPLSKNKSKQSTHKRLQKNSAIKPKE